PVRVLARPVATGVGADVAGAGLGGRGEDVGVVTAPGVVDQVGTGLAGPAGHRPPPGVDADDQLGVLGPDLLDEGDHAARLLQRGDLRSGAGPDAADVDPVGTGVHRAPDRPQRSVVADEG